MARGVDPDGYRRWARLYDWLARATAGVGGVRTGAVDALNLAPGDTVVEFGCGPGVNLPALRERVGPTGHVVGIDLAARMLQRARQRLSRRGWENVSLVRGDATAPPMADVDAVLATFVTSQFPDPAAVVSNWCALGDRVVVATFAPGGNQMANAALWALTRLNGALFAGSNDDALAQLDKRTAAAHRALERQMDTVVSDSFLFGTVTIAAGYREP